MDKQGIEMLSRNNTIMTVMVLSRLCAATRRPAQLYCFGPYDAGVSQIVAYRASAGGNYQLMAQVLASTGEIDELGMIQNPDTDVLSVSVRHKTVEGSAVPEFSVVTQTRYFGWTGSRFTQTRGPASFAVSPDLDSSVSVTAGELSFGKPEASGCRTGTMTVTVRNHRATPLQGVYAAVIAPESGTGVCVSAPNQADGSASVPVPALAAGEEATLTVTFVIGSYPTDVSRVDQPWNFVQLRLRDEFGERYFAAKTQFVVSYG